MHRHSSSTSGFKEIAIFCLKLVAFSFLLFLYINHVLPQFEGEYNAALIDKVARLESTEGARIVLIGDSNLVFGMDSAKLEEAFGMPVVNMGLNAAMGNCLMRESAKLNVHEGDIYILSSVKYADNDKIRDGVAAWVSVENHYHLWRLLRLKDSIKMARNFPIYLHRCVEYYKTGTGNQESPTSVYTRSAFNEYGDIAAPRIHDYTFDEPVEPPEINDTCIREINRLNDYLTARGAILLITSRPFGDGELTADTEVFRNFDAILRERLNCPVISDSEDYLYDYSYFFDERYHLTTEGVPLRTQQLIDDLNAYFETVGHDSF